MQRLLLAARAVRVAAVEGIKQTIPQYGVGHLDGEGIGHDICEQKGPVMGWLLLKMTTHPSADLFALRLRCQKFVCVCCHAFAQHVEAGGIDGLLQDHVTLVAQGGRGLQQRLGVEASGELLIG
tara:strand:- start:217 stop:588 length:372 start_codon:yes stop_codon:yes gene_type:complete